MAKTGKSLMDLIEIAAKRQDGASGRRLADLAQRAGHDISHATLNRLRQGTYASRPTDASIRAIAYLAEVPETVAFAAVGVRPPAADQYQVPIEAQRMSTRQRRALDELLRAFVVEQTSPTAPGLAPLLAARDELAAALDTAGVETSPLAAAAHAAIAAIDDATAALFSRGTDNPGELPDDPTRPPAGDTAPMACAVG
ncbi:hypothetical protein [[Mycobacterium] zoologicum]|jgi:hypothetical protein|uniref:hypothetical protein n=1 Tax=[Mycobacterium] zoologicum TaxID=2872311 RepID=UPI001CDAFE65|nr:hypothetical protein [Mycolicibacter sp. MYC101]MEB3064373.1 hypothetical protein [Mycolicibacter sp. MYC101]